MPHRIKCLKWKSWILRSIKFIRFNYFVNRTEQFLKKKKKNRWNWNCDAHKDEIWNEGLKSGSERWTNTGHDYVPPQVFSLRTQFEDNPRRLNDIGVSFLFHIPTSKQPNNTEPRTQLALHLYCWFLEVSDPPWRWFMQNRTTLKLKMYLYDF